MNAYSTNHNITFLYIKAHHDNYLPVFLYFLYLVVVYDSFNITNANDLGVTYNSITSLLGRRMLNR